MNKRQMMQRVAHTVPGAIYADESTCSLDEAYQGELELEHNGESHLLLEDEEGKHWLLALTPL